MSGDMTTNNSAVVKGQRLGRFAPYKEAYVLLLYWKDADAAFYKQLHNLGLRFQSLYGYDVEEWPIDSEESYRKLNQKLFQFLEHDKDDVLLILYYGGHGSINQDRHHVWLCHDPNLDVDNPSINWSSLQQLFLNDCKSHVLFLLDCCRAAASVQDSAGSSLVELIAAAGFESVTPRRGQHTFTSNLILTLDDCRGLPVRTPDLMRKLTARLKHHWPTEAGNEKRVTPGHFIISNDVQAAYIVLGKLRGTSLGPVQKEPTPNLPTAMIIQNQEVQGMSILPASKAETPLTENFVSVGTANSQGSEPEPLSKTTSHQNAESRKNLVRRPPRPGLVSRAKPGIATGGEILYSPENTYKYSPIDPDHIRIIHLLPGNKGDPLICKISSRRLKDVENEAAVEYQAISHVWDVSPKRHKLQVVDQGDIYVGSHDYAVLCRLRDAIDVTIVWIDDLSVDLNNQEEKLSQFAMLAEVFYNAWHVCAWLGDDGDGSDILQSFIPRLLDLKHIDKLVECESKPEEWQAFAALMMRPWFNRRWIIQELISAREATLYCGSEFAIAWPDFCDAVALFGSKFDEIRKLFKKSPQFDHNPENLVDIRALGSFSLVEASKNIFRQSSSVELKRRTVGLETLASYLPVQQSSDPRDTIYSLLSLASDSSPTSFQVDYNKSCLQVFKDFIEFCVHESKSIDIICRPWAPESMQLSIRHSGISAHPGLGRFLNPEIAPSWIPKISNLPFGKRGKNHYGRINGDSLIGQPNRKYYNASKGTSGMILFGENDRNDCETPALDGSITVSGIQIARIESLGPRAADGTILADWTQMGEWNEGDTFVPDYFWRTLVADRGPNGIQPPAWYHRACLYCLEQCGGGDITLAQLSLGSCPSMAVEFLIRVRNVIWNRRFLRTSDEPGEGLFGLAPSKSREGDTISILHGCSVPVLLRRHKRFAGAWELIGECFVYGMMEGEAMIMEGSSPILTEEFEIR